MLCCIGKQAIAKREVKLHYVLIMMQLFAASSGETSLKMKLVLHYTILKEPTQLEVKNVATTLPMFKFLQFIDVVER